MKGNHENVRSTMEQSDARIKYLEEELRESTKKVHSNFPFFCEQTSLFMVNFLRTFALLHSTYEVAPSTCPHVHMMQLLIWWSEYLKFVMKNGSKNYEPFQFSFTLEYFNDHFT